METLQEEITKLDAEITMDNFFIERQKDLFQEYLDIDILLLITAGSGFIFGYFVMGKSIFFKLLQILSVTTWISYRIIKIVS